MSDSRPKKLVAALALAMEEVEQIAGSTGPDKKAYTVQAMRSIAVHTLSFDEALLVGDLAPHIVDLIVAASKGLLHVNEKGEPSPRCFSKSCALL